MQEGNSPFLLPPPSPGSPGLLFPSREIDRCWFILPGYILPTEETEA